MGGILGQLRVRALLCAVGCAAAFGLFIIPTECNCFGYTHRGAVFGVDMSCAGKSGVDVACAEDFGVETGHVYVPPADTESLYADSTEGQVHSAVKAAAPKKITLHKTKATLYAGEYIIIKVKKFSGSQKAHLKFSSNQKKVASVNDRGEVTAKKKGTAIITVTSKSNKKAKAKFKLTVKAKPKKSSLAIKNKKLSVTVGKTTLLHITKLTGVSSSNVIYHSSNPAVAAVSAKGVVKGVAAGTATVTVTSAVNKRVKAVCAVTVTQAAAAISVPKQVTLEPAKGIMVYAMVLPGTVRDKNVSAVSDNPDIAWAQAEDGGRVGILAVKEGKTTVTVKTTDGRVSAAIYVTVKKDVVPVTELTLHETLHDGYARRVPVGGKAALALRTQVLPAHADNRAVYFYSDDTNVATVDQKGYVTGVGAGACKVYAMTCDGSGLFKSCEIYVDAAPIMREKEVYAYLREHPEERSMYVAMTPGMYADLEASMEARGFNKTWIADHYEKSSGWHYVRGEYGDHGYDGIMPDGTCVYSNPDMWYWDLGLIALAINIWEEE